MPSVQWTNDEFMLRACGTLFHQDVFSPLLDLGRLEGSAGFPMMIPPDCLHTVYEGYVKK
jgi:hypothetical protein